MLLEDKNAVLYGAGSSVGGAVVRAFAWEEARVFLAGRTRKPLGAVVAGVMAARATTKGRVCHVGNGQPARDARRSGCTSMP